MTSSLARMMAIKCSIYSRQQSRRLSVCIFYYLSAPCRLPLPLLIREWNFRRRSIAVSVCVCVRACLTIIFGQKLTSERKHAEFIIMIVHTDHMQRIFDAAKDATKGQWGVHWECELWGSSRATVASLMPSMMSIGIAYFFSFHAVCWIQCILSSLNHTQSQLISLFMLPFLASSVWGFSSSQ